MKYMPPPSQKKLFAGYINEWLDMYSPMLWD